MPLLNFLFFFVTKCMSAVVAPTFLLSIRTMAHVVLELIDVLINRHLWCSALSHRLTATFVQRRNRPADFFFFDSLNYGDGMSILCKFGLQMLFIPFYIHKWPDELR
jgi:hypothetical protein